MSNSRIKDALRFSSHLRLKKILNAIKIKVSYYVSVITGWIIHWGYPYSMSIEPTTTCNLQCLECPTGLNGLKRKSGSINIDEFSRIIDEVHSKLMSLILYFQGEPLLNNDFAKMISLAHGKNIYTITSTNAHFLDDKNCKAIVESGLDRLIISYDGITQDAYSRYRVGGELETVEKGIETILKWKKNLRKSNPYVILQFLVLGVNEHQISEAKLKAKQWHLPLHLKTAQVYDFENNAFLIPSNKIYSRYKKDAQGKYVMKDSFKNQCFRMWSGAVITWDGNIVPCCFDKDAEHKMGNLKISSFKEIWNNEEYNSFRKKVFRDRKGVEICRNCTE